MTRWARGRLPQQPETVERAVRAAQKPWAERRPALTKPDANKTMSVERRRGRQVVSQRLVSEGLRWTGRRNSQSRFSKELYQPIA
jgi:hypothetical protein